MEKEYCELLIGVDRKYSEEILVETKADATDRGGAEKVLSLEADVRLTGAELLEGEGEVTAKVNYRLLYLDRQSRLCGLDYFKDFKCRVSGESIKPNGKCAVTFAVPDAEARAVGDAIEMSAVVDVTLRYFGEEEKKAVASVAGAECRKKEIHTERAERRERTLELEKTLDSGPNVKKIMLFDVESVPTSLSRSEGEVTVMGEARANVIYLNEADETVELTASLPFTETFEGDGEAEYLFSVKSSRIVLTDDEEGSAVDVEVTVEIDEIAYEKEVTTVADAALSAACETIERSESVEERSFAGEYCFEETVSGALPLSAEGAYIAFVRPSNQAVAEVTVKEGAVGVEGVAAFRIVYLTEKGYDSTQGEFPFSYAFPVPTAKEGMDAEMRIVITQPQAIYDGKEVRVSAKVTALLTLWENATQEYLSDVEEGESFPESEAGITVYFAEKGEDLWRIAKNMKTLPSTLVQANPFLSEPLSENKKVLIFRKK